MPSNLQLPYTKDEINKIGNTIVFLAENIQPLSKTKLLKLIYLIEEMSIKKYGLPFLNLKFEVWKLGPVARDIYIETTGGLNILKDFIEIGYDHENNSLIKPKVDFCDDEFSDNELDILDICIKNFQNKNANQLIDITHKKGSPWYEFAKKNDVLEPLTKGLMTSTDIEIDFADYFSDNEDISNRYKNQLEYLAQNKSIKMQG